MPNGQRGRAHTIQNPLVADQLCCGARGPGVTAVARLRQRKAPDLLALGERSDELLLLLLRAVLHDGPRVQRLHGGSRQKESLENFHYIPWIGKISDLTAFAYVLHINSCGILANIGTCLFGN